MDLVSQRKVRARTERLCFDRNPIAISRLTGGNQNGPSFPYAPTVNAELGVVPLKLDFPLVVTCPSRTVQSLILMRQVVVGS